MRYTKLMVVLIAMTLVPVIYTAEPSSPVDQAMVERQNLGLLKVLSNDMLNAQIAPYLSLQDIACVRRTCRYLSKHFLDYVRVLEFNMSDLQNRFADKTMKSKVMATMGDALRLVGLDYTFHCDPRNLQLYSLQLSLANFIARFKKCQNRLALDLRSNELTVLPAEIRQLTQLRVLDLYCNNLRQQAIRNICFCSGLQALYVGLNNLAEIPAEIRQLKQLKRLGLSGNQLSQESICHICFCPQLQVLDLGGNQLTELPAEMRQLTQLEKIALHCNNISQQAIRNICLCSQLQEIDFSLNQLTELPAEIQQLKQLKILNLGHNNLNQQVIRNICLWFSQLRELDLRYNQLVTLPAEIQQLTHLARLDLRGNPLSAQTRDMIRNLLPNTRIIF